MTTPSIPSARLRSRFIRGTAAISALACASLGLVTLSAHAEEEPADASKPATVTYPQAHISFPGNDGKAHTVTYDKHSFKIDGEPLSIWSGEIHYWRAPDVNSWRDLFQKMKANGYNAVSLYFFWGLHQQEKDGAFDFSEGTIKDIDLLMTMAEEEGLYIIARPGPYINAEISMGGLPAYMTNYSAGLRTTDPEVMAASKQWLSAFDNIVKKHLITNGGGSVILYQIENELLDQNANRQEFLRQLTTFVKSDGINVPVFHNDWGMAGRFKDTASYGTDFYAYDTYPVGFNCSAERKNLPDLETGLRGITANTPNFITETQGGAFTPWGASYNASDCYKYTDEGFTRQWGSMAIGNGMTAFNYYMAFGGTNWGWTGAPASGFTSYDYGAGITEDRVMTAKASAQKETGYYEQAVPEFATMDPVAAPKATSVSGSTAIKTYQRVSTANKGQGSVTGNGVRTVVVRLSNSNDETNTELKIPLSLGVDSQAQLVNFSHDDRSDAITYTGTWEKVDDAASSQGTLMRSKTKNDRASFTFDGTSIRVVVNTGTDHGAFTVTVDNQAPVTVNSAKVDSEQNKPTQLVAFTKDGLSAGEHTVVVTNTGGEVVDIDAFDVPQAEATQMVQINDSNKEFITYSSDNWQHATGQGWTSGDIDADETYSSTAGDSYSFSFTGVGFDLVGPYSENHGPADVYVDGKKIGQTHEEVTSSAQGQQTVFSWRADDTATPKQHTVRVVVTGEAFPGSKGSFVSLDAIRYYPDASAVPAEGPAEGEIAWASIPQKDGTALSIHGRDAIILTADKVIAGHDMYYTTSQLFGAPLSTDAGVVQYLLAANGNDGETVLHYNQKPTVNAPEGVESTWDAETGQLRLNYTHEATPQMITVTDAEGQKLSLRVIDRDYAVTTFILEGTRSGDQAAAHTIAVEGAELARTVVFDGTTAKLTGSVTKAGKVSVLAPTGVKKVTWNGGTEVAAQNGQATLDVAGPAEVAQQTLKFVKAEDNQETTVGYDDSGWIAADDTTAANKSQGPGTTAKVVLDSNHYGAYEGSVWYRAKYTSSVANPTITLTGNGGSGVPGQGKNPAFMQVWANGTYVGAYPATGAAQSVKIPDGVVTAGGQVVLAVLVNNLGQNLDWSDNGLSKQNRGLFDADLKANGTVTWKLKGASQDLIKSATLNPSGTLYNNGGLGGEAAGWHTAQFNDSEWAQATDLHSDNAGVTWYRAKATLNVPAGTDPAFRLDINSAKFASLEDHAQATIFVNGWNTGVYIGDIGPQKSFTVPTAFLNLNGENTIAIAVASKTKGAGPDSVVLRAIHTDTVPAAASAESGTPNPQTTQEPTDEPTKAPTNQPTDEATDHPTTEPSQTSLPSSGEPNTTQPTVSQSPSVTSGTTGAQGSGLAQTGATVGILIVGAVVLLVAGSVLALRRRGNER